MTQKRINRLVRASPKFQQLSFKDNGEPVDSTAVFNTLATSPDTEVDNLLAVLEWHEPAMHKGYFIGLWNEVKKLGLKMVIGVAKKVNDITIAQKAKAEADMHELLRFMEERLRNTTDSDSLFKASETVDARKEGVLEALRFQGLESHAANLEARVRELDDEEYRRQGEEEEAPRRKEARPFYDLLQEPNLPWDDSFLELVANVHQGGIHYLHGGEYSDLLPTIEAIHARHPNTSCYARRGAYLGVNASMRLPNGQPKEMVVSLAVLKLIYKQHLNEAQEAPVVDPIEYQTLEDMPFSCRPLPPLPVMPPVRATVPCNPVQPLTVVLSRAGRRVASGCVHGRVCEDPTGL